MVAGLYASISSIIDGESAERHSQLMRLKQQPGYRQGGFPGPFTCASQAL